MKSVKNTDRDAKNKIITYILEEYDKNYRKKFMKSEFEDSLSLNEIIEELKELKYIKITKNAFTITLLGIRHIREINFSRTQYLENYRITIIGLVLSSVIALMANTITIYSFDSVFMRIFLSVTELLLFILVYYGLKNIFK